jgi:diacylglycerol kinase (ATP)
MTRTDAEYSSEHNPYKGNRGIARACHAARNSWSGLVFAIREESAFRQELALTACLIPLALLLSFGALDRLMLIGSVVLVLIVELVNSSIEAAIDRISFEHHGLSKRAKDYGSAAVMLALLMCAAVWITLTCRLFAG